MTRFNQYLLTDGWWGRGCELGHPAVPRTQILKQSPRLSYDSVEKLFIKSTGDWWRFFKTRSSWWWIWHHTPVVSTAKICQIVSVKTKDLLMKAKQKEHVLYMNMIMLYSKLNFEKTFEINKMYFLVMFRIQVYQFNSLLKVS